MRSGTGQPRVVTFVATLAALALMAFGVMSALAVDPANPAFERTWARTDRPVNELRVDRTWMWGPTANTGARQERYVDSPGGLRTVQYYDKSRMEINDPDKSQDDPWYVTNGLLVKELITGQMQIGDDAFETMEPATDVNVAGDPNDSTGPTYGTFTELLDAPPLADGSAIIWRLARDGTITNDLSLADHGVTAAYRVTVDGIDHQVASVFWDFMWSEGLIYQDGEYVIDMLFDPPFYATGYPITEAYWASVKVAGEQQDVLMQCFERRCLTYTPGNEPGWQVEAGNVGQHYFRWRYDRPTGSPTATATPTETPAQEEWLFAAALTGDEEGPVVEPEASGMAYVHVLPDGSQIDYQITVENITNVSAAHLHRGEEGEDGEIVATLFSARDTPVTPNGVLAAASIDTDDLPDDLSIIDLVEAMITGETYIDVHTTTEPDGEIRGRISVLGDVVFSTSLSGESAIPPVETDASGDASFLYDSEAGVIEFQLNLDALQGLTAVHIHQGARDENGPFLALLFGASSPVNSPIEANGTITENDLLDAALAELVYLMLTGETYVDAHTSAIQGSEVRGQIVVGIDATASGVWIAEMTGSNETPSVETDATGYVVVTLEEDGSLSSTVIVAGVEDVTAAHIHARSATREGDILATLFEESTRTPAIENGILAEGTIPSRDVEAALLYGLVNQGVYVDVHTAAEPEGEIRGQIEMTDGEVFLAELEPENEGVPDATATIDSDATGVALLWSNPGMTAVEYVIIVSNLENPTNAHIHIGGTDENGRVLVTVFDELPATPGPVDGELVTGTIEPDDLTGPLEGMAISDLVAEIVKANTYVNVHTAAYPDGEIRGQITRRT